MERLKLVMLGGISAIGVTLYTGAVSVLMHNAEQWFGNGNELWAPMLFLMLFVVSATSVGSMVLGRPAYLFLTDQRKQAVELLLYTIGWMLALTTTAFMTYALIR